MCWRDRQIRERQGDQAVLVLLCVLGWRVREQTLGLGKLSLNPGSGFYQQCDLGQVSFLINKDVLPNNISRFHSPSVIDDLFFCHE